MRRFITAVVLCGVSLSSSRRRAILVFADRGGDDGARHEVRGAREIGGDDLCG